MGQDVPQTLPIMLTSPRGASEIPTIRVGVSGDPHSQVLDTEAVDQKNIDEAWRLAHTRRLRPVAEGERSSYTVDRGRRIGFLGGRTGAAQKHPPLSRVFIVFETGTTNLITAFPK